MKNLHVFILFLLIVSCNQQEKEMLNMSGAYFMSRQVTNDGAKDSLIDR